MMREWSLPPCPAERHLLVAELERVQFMGDEESEIVQFILRQFPECARESDCAVRRVITAAKKRLQNLLYKQTHNFEFWTAQRTDSAAAAAAAAAAPGVETKRNQRRSQIQPTRYYDRAPAMNWDHAVSWGWGVWVSVSDIGRVGSGWPLYTKP